MTGNSFYSLEKHAESRSGGTTQAETRLYNERLVLSLIRRRQQLSKVELTRLTGLSAQTITTLVNRAAEGGLLTRKDAIRGRIGQPSIPYALNPDGVYSMGLRIGRRNCDMVLADFIGNLVAFEQMTFDYPTPDHVMRFAETTVARFLAERPEAARRIAGLGIASPFQLWNWSHEMGTIPGAINAWRNVDIRAELDLRFDWPVYLLNDGMVAAGAELLFGTGAEVSDFLYAYIGFFAGGGLVLDHHIYPGRHKRGGSLGEMLVPASEKSNHTAQLLERASLHRLSGRIKARGADDAILWSVGSNWDDLGGDLDAWIDEVADGLAHAMANVVAVLDIETLIIDGAIPIDVRRRIARATRMKLGPLMTERTEPFGVLEGSFAHAAPAMGGATLPLLVNYSNDREVLFKD